ncbi:nuclear transport factor 2 family protein [Novosphingobium profundi]|uniref:nuclear transport factor 2 family protein n=1 Tax=Novosphingobium profundi TaxID=1774954 RepID=UPI001BD9D0E1|nr:nuclear transport factor 2 family protein [Novosphingobium profundi]MBT0670827.1 nuclear transport factor 2 family protein [Novosphingobium profundi]
MTATALRPAAQVPEGQTPPVVASDHAQLLASADPVLAANKRLCYDMYRVVLQGGHAGRAHEFIAPGYIQHNPNVVSGRAALEAFIRGSRPERAIRPTIELPLVAMLAERDMVSMAFVRTETDAQGQIYHTSWFDLFRIENGLIAEHWDPATKSAAMLKTDPNRQRLD